MFKNNITVMEKKLYHDIHLFLAVKMGVAICNFYESSFRSHPPPAIFSCTKQFVLLLDIENNFNDYQHTGL